MARGRKTCPGCRKEHGARQLVCGCGHDFVAAKKERDVALFKEAQEKKELREKARKGSTEALSPKMQEMLKIKHEPMPKRSPKEHAKRILSYGVVRASLLLQQARNLKTWSHVDWKYVEAHLSSYDPDKELVKKLQGANEVMMYGEGDPIVHSTIVEDVE